MTTTFEEYLSWPEVSVSGLTRVLKNPRSVLKEIKTTPAMTLGSALHCMCLEPLEYPKRYTTPLQCASTKKSGEQCKNPGVKLVDGTWLCGVHSRGISGDSQLVIVPEADLGLLERQREMLLEHPLWPKAFDSVECSVRGEAWGLGLKARPDAVLGGTIYDLKRMAQPDRVRWMNDWVMRAAVYLELTGLEQYVYVVIGEDSVEMYRVTPEQIAAGRADAEEACSVWKECVARDEWPCTSGEMKDLPVAVFREMPEPDWTGVEVESE